MAKGRDQFETHFDRMRETKERQRKDRPSEEDGPAPPPPETIHKDAEEPGRNDPCPCGSGKKYKQCCLKKKDKKKGWFSK